MGVKCIQRSGTEAIRIQLQPSKPKREIHVTNITNSQDTKITYGQPSEQLFPKRPRESYNKIMQPFPSTQKQQKHKYSTAEKPVHFS